MARFVFCNSCLRKLRNPTLQFFLTSCGHVFCEVCLKKGKKDECLVCKSAYRTVVLSKEISPDIQSLFMPVDMLCEKYSKEVSQISEFQEKHRKRLFKCYKQKIAKLEESLKKERQQMKERQQIQQMQCMKPPEKTTPLPFSKTTPLPFSKTTPLPFSKTTPLPFSKATPLPFSSASRNPFSIPSRKQNASSSYSLHSGHPSTSETMEAMEMDPIPSPMRKLETPTGPTRLSVITPPQDGHMGSVSYRGSQTAVIMPRLNTAGGSTRSTPVTLPHSACPSSSGSQSSRRGFWANSDFRTPQLYPYVSPSPQQSASRQPITIPGLLQRQHGSTNLGGHSAER